MTPEEVATVVAFLEAEGRAERSDVVVWAIAPDATRRLSYEQAGATWLIEGPSPGPDWVEDAAALAVAGPPAS